MLKLNIIVLISTLISDVRFTADAQCTLASTCISDITQNDCAPGEYLIENSAVFGCCPSCQKIRDNPLCSIVLPCPPGKTCVSNVCVLDYSSCWHTLHLPDDQKPRYPLTCNPDGTYAAVQCKGDGIVGRCFCSDPAGKRIFGRAWASKAQDMTCACSRKRAELEKAGRIDVSIHCKANGNYEELQCDSELCWCVNEKTGDVVSRVTNENLVSQLPCFNAESYGSQYMRICESKSYAVSKIRLMLARHGTTTSTVESANCDYDGSYGAYQIILGVALCTWKDGKRLGSWQVEAGVTLATMNCNCARDTKYYEEINQVMTQSCAGNGNYNPQQQYEGRLYCVDGDGFPTSELAELGELISCF